MKKGFTLVEILVVLAIIATLMGAMLVSMGGSKDEADKANVRQRVLDASAALQTVYAKNNNSWPKSVISHNNGQLDEKVATVFARNGLLGLAFKTSGDSITLQGNDRCGIVDHWGAATLKKSTSKEGTGDKSKRVGNGAGGTVEDHILWYAVDEDGDGFTEISAEGIGSLKVRGIACVWAAGKDGKVASYDDADRSDDVYSWSYGQVDR